MRIAGFRPAVAGHIDFAAHQALWLQLEGRLVEEACSILPRYTNWMEMLFLDTALISGGCLLKIEKRNRGPSGP